MRLTVADQGSTHAHSNASLTRVIFRERNEIRIGKGCAGADEIVDPRGSRAFVFAAPRYVVTARELPGLYHEIFNEAEPARSEVLALLREWLDTTVK